MRSPSNQSLDNQQAPNEHSVGCLDLPVPNGAFRPETLTNALLFPFVNYQKEKWKEDPLEMIDPRNSARLCSSNDAFFAQCPAIVRTKEAHIWNEL